MLGNSKLEVLESKLVIYEELSKEMLLKLESAVEKISEGNSRIAQILTRHEEKIEQNSKSDQLILKMFDDNNTKIFDKIKNLETKVEDIAKTKWIVIGMGAFFTIIISALGIIYPLIDQYTPKPQQEQGYVDRSRR